MRGRKPKPTALRALEGNAGKRPLPELEPKPPVVDILPPAPRRLGKWGRAQWRRQVATLTSTRVLTVADLLALEQLCARAEELDGLTAWFQREQRQPLKTRNTDLLLRLHAAIDRKQGIAAKLEGEFGLMPSSRTRVKTERSPGIHDKLGAFQKARRVAPSA